MYISINKAWFDKNRKKLEDASDNDESLVIDSDNLDLKQPDLLDGVQDDGSICINQEDTNKNVWVSLDYTPEPEVIAALVETSMDNLKGDSLTKVIEVVVKKLNKLRSFIESIKGL